MKRLMLFAVALLSAIASIACPPPTTHAIVQVGAVYIHELPTPNEKASLNNLGVHAAFGIETPNRYSTISVETMAINLSNKTDWCIGLKYGLNPLGIRYCDSPVNFKINVGCGYKSNNAIYGNVGLQLELGYEDSWLIPYAALNVGFTEKIDNKINAQYGTAFALGIRIRMGKSW